MPSLVSQSLLSMENRKVSSLGTVSDGKVINLVWLGGA